MLRSDLPARPRNTRFATLLTQALMPIKALIIDDEPLARERIRTLLAEEADFRVAGECGDGPSAVSAILKERPDVVFLDIQMPGMDGFGVLRELPRDALPLVIFVTAYDQHALKAFEVHALDYLLKPFKQTRFKETVQRARERLKSRDHGLPQSLLDALQSMQKPREFVSRLSIREGERVLFLKTDAVDYIESAGNYVVVHAGKDNHVVRETLTNLEENLDPKKFLRISRSTLVNLDRVKELQPLFKGEHAVVLQNGKQLTMTRGLRDVQDALKFS